MYMYNFKGATIMQQDIFNFLNRYGNGTDKELVDLVMNQFCIPYTIM